MEVVFWPPKPRCCPPEASFLVQAPSHLSPSPAGKGKKKRERVGAPLFGTLPDLGVASATPVSTRSSGERAGGWRGDGSRAALDEPQERVYC